MKEWFILLVLKGVFSITHDQWDAALEAVQHAATELSDKTGSDRKKYVVDTIRSAFNKNWKTAALDVLVGLAYGFAQKKGYIK